MVALLTVRLDLTSRSHLEDVVRLRTPSLDKVSSEMLLFTQELDTTGYIIGDWYMFDTS